jgi:hypothetical protein
MREITAAIVCIAVLYGVDAFWFDGRYFAAASLALRQVYVYW